MNENRRCSTYFWTRPSRYVRATIAQAMKQRPQPVGVRDVNPDAECPVGTYRTLNRPPHRLSSMANNVPHAEPHPSWLRRVAIAAREPPARGGCGLTRGSPDSTEAGHAAWVGTALAHQVCRSFPCCRPQARRLVRRQERREATPAPGLSAGRNPVAAQGQALPAERNPPAGQTRDVPQGRPREATTKAGTDGAWAPPWLLKASRSQYPDSIQLSVLLLPHDAALRVPESQPCLILNGAGRSRKS